MQVHNNGKEETTNHKKESTASSAHEYGSDWHSDEGPPPLVAPSASEYGSDSDSQDGKHMWPKFGSGKIEAGDLISCMIHHHVSGSNEEK